MKRTALLILIACACAGTCIAQSPDSLSRADRLKLHTQQSFLQTQETLRNWDTEHLLDSLDQENLPKTVSGGILAGPNISNFIITRDHRTFSSHMRVGAEFGGFIDFRVTKHFHIEGQLFFTAEQNYFEDGTGSQHLWAFGTEIPVYFMGNYGSLERGYLLYGGGPFTHFTFASNVSSRYSNNAADPAASPVLLSDNPDSPDSDLRYKLHDSHSGLGVTIGYEFPIGIRLMATYKVSLSDIFSFYRENDESEVGDINFYPQHAAITIGYHWR